MKITLNQIKVGNKAVICKLHNGDGIRRRLLDMGMIPGTVVESVMKSPGGDPTAYLIRGALVALREEESMQIEVENYE